MYVVGQHSPETKISKIEDIILWLYFILEGIWTAIVLIFHNFPNEGKAEPKHPFI